MGGGGVSALVGIAGRRGWSEGSVPNEKGKSGIGESPPPSIFRRRRRQTRDMFLAFLSSPSGSEYDQHGEACPNRRSLYLKKIPWEVKDYQNHIKEYCIVDRNYCHARKYILKRNFFHCCPELSLSRIFLSMVPAKKKSCTWNVFPTPPMLESPLFRKCKGQSSGQKSQGGEGKEEGEHFLELRWKRGIRGDLTVWHNCVA